MPRACIDQEMRLARVLARMELQGFAVVRAVCAASSEDERFLRWVITDVTFHNCVPESAVSVYPRDVTVPLVEAPLSTASSLSDGAPPLDLCVALKIEDVAAVLPEALGNTQKTGILLRRTRGQIQRDAELRRLVAGTVRAAKRARAMWAGRRSGCARRHDWRVLCHGGRRGLVCGRVALCVAHASRLVHALWAVLGACLLSVNVCESARATRTVVLQVILFRSVEREPLQMLCFQSGKAVY